MRKMMIALAVLPFAACSDGVTFDLTSTMEAQTRGVAMFNWNDQGVAGMLDQTCSFDIAEGRVLGDLVDLPGTDDRVVDGDGAQALVTSGGDVWSVSDWGETFAVATPGQVVDAAFTRDGVASISANAGGCAVHFADGSQASIDLAGMDCSSASLESTRSSEFVFVADGTSVVRVDQATTLEIERGADLLSFDDGANILVIANSNGSDIRGVDVNGNTEWTVTVDGIVDSIDSMGWERFTVASFTTSDGSSEIVVLNSNSGDVHAQVDVPDTVDVTASPDGTTVALDDGGAIHFYDVTPQNAVLGAPSVQPQTQPTFGD